MKTRNKYIICLLLMFLINFSNNLKAQDSCEVAFIQATKAYEDGNYEKVISLLKDRIRKCDYSTDTKLQIYKLLSASYSEIDEIELAEKSTYKFIKRNPEYVPQSIDPLSFINSFEKYNIRPNLAFGMDAILRNPKVNVLKEFYIFDTTNYNSRYSNRYSLDLNVYIEKYFSNIFSTSIHFINGSFKYSKFYSYSDSTKFEYSESFLKYKFANLNSFQLAKITLGVKSNVTICISAGFYVYYISNFKTSLKINDTEHDIDYNMNKVRLPLNAGALSGFSINWKLERINIRFQYKYSRDFFIFNIPQNRYIYPDFNINYYYVDNNIKFTQKEFSIGFSYNLIYKVKHKYHKK